MKKFGFIFFSLIAFAFFIFSCSSTKSKTYMVGYKKKIVNVEINEIGTYHHALIDPLPIKVGVYYGNDFSTFETNQNIEIGRGPVIAATYIYNSKMGKANIALFDYILSIVFEKVTPVQYLSEGSNHKKDIALIVEPEVHNFTLISGIDPIANGFDIIHITYVINFYLPDGEKISSWNIKGSGASPIALAAAGFINETQFVELTQMAMREVASKFMTDFCNQVDIKKLFYKQCNQ